MREIGFWVIVLTCCKVVWSILRFILKYILFAPFNLFKFIKRKSFELNDF